MGQESPREVDRLAAQRLLQRPAERLVPLVNRTSATLLAVLPTRIGQIREIWRGSFSDERER